MLECACDSVTNWGCRCEGVLPLAKGTSSCSNARSSAPRPLHVIMCGYDLIATLDCQYIVKELPLAKKLACCSNARSTAPDNCVSDCVHAFSQPNWLRTWMRIEISQRFVILQQRQITCIVCQNVCRQFDRQFGFPDGKAYVYIFIIAVEQSGP